MLTEQSLGRLFLATNLVCLLLIGSVLAWFISLRLPVINSVADYKPPQATLILDRRGEPLDVLAREFRLVLPYADLRAVMRIAFV